MSTWYSLALTGDQGPLVISLAFAIASNQMGFDARSPCFYRYPHFINDGTPGTGYALSLVASAVGSSCKAEVYRLVNPVASTIGTSSVRVNAGGSLHGGTIAYAWSLTGVHQTSPERDTAPTSGPAPAPR